MLYTNYLIIYEANAVVNIIMLIMRIRHVIRLHVEDEDVVAQEAALAVQYIVHFRLIFHLLKCDLLLRA